ncbi:MAG: NAD(P)/FAD-dependent oxidoreductase [Actinomycetota bacterium]|nr:NAD(P)/FAD-dependent oxidoreductase [Actinomycetota bacterium]
MTHHVVVVGGGFGGLQAVKHLRHAPVEVTLVDARNFHLFQPLTYQVATGALSPSDVTYPLRSIFGSASNVRVAMAEVTDFDLEARRVHLAVPPNRSTTAHLDYDSLVVAAGSSYSYFGHEEWREVAGEVKSLESAVAVRTRILDGFERAELCTDDAHRSAEMTFVVVGGGPTGVEIAGQIAELSRDTLAGSFARIDPGHARILLIETAARILTGFPESLAAKATGALRELGVEVAVERTVVAIDSDGVTLRAPDGTADRVPARTVIWAAGVRASGLAQRLGELTGAAVDKAGRVTVAPDLTLPGHPEVIALGDMASVSDGRGGTLGLPGLAPVAIQQGAYAARRIVRRLQGRPVRPFRYRDKGNLATIGRGAAVAELGPIRLSGVPAWLIWLGVHIWYLIGFQNRLVVMLRWAISFLTSGRAQGSRIISLPPSE